MDIDINTNSTMLEFGGEPGMGKSANLDAMAKRAGLNVVHLDRVPLSEINECVDGDGVDYGESAKPSTDFRSYETQDNGKSDIVGEMAKSVGVTLTDIRMSGESHTVKVKVSELLNLPKDVTIVSIQQGYRTLDNFDTFRLNFKTSTGELLSIIIACNPLEIFVTTNTGSSSENTDEVVSRITNHEWLSVKLVELNTCVLENNSEKAVVCINTIVRLLKRDILTGFKFAHSANLDASLIIPNIYKIFPANEECDC